MSPQNAPDKSILWHELAESELLKEARSSILAFTRFTKPDYEINWHHRLLCAYLDKFARGEIKRLLVSMPPRHGKSELVSRRLPAFIFGINPHAQIISASYGSDLSSRLNRDVQRIIDNPNYQELFPHVKLNSSNVRTVAQGTYLRNNDIFEIVGHRGVYRSSGVGGGITGMGADFAIIDDPIKNQEEADSVTYRERVWEWYVSTLYTRLEKEGSVLLTMTRWHQDDLAGRLLALAKANKDADQWVVLELPAICDDQLNELDPRELGQALWENKYNVQRLAKMRASSGARVWSALYQQRPSPDGGTLIKREWMQKFYKELPADISQSIQSWDLTFTEGPNTDFVVGQVWGKRGAERWLYPIQFRARIGFNGQIVAMETMTATYPNAKAKIVEKSANAYALQQVLEKKVSGIILVKPMGSKIARVEAITPQWEAGNVWLPHPSIAPWIGDFIEECAAFPYGKNDDQVDTMSQALYRLGSGPRTDIKIGSLTGISKWNRI